MIYKTPGVYIQEISTFPPSVVPVETAIPAFVGHTQQARDSEGNDLTMKPTRIESLLEYNTYFGGEYRPATYAVELDTTDNANTIGEVTPLDGDDAPRRFYLYGCIRHFYANGGGPCYIVSVASYDHAPVLDDGAMDPPIALDIGLAQLEQVDEPTLLLAPDGVLLNAVDLGNLQKAALTQCNTLQDRFVIMDLHQGNRAVDVSIDPVGIFREAIGTQFLKYGAAYYPWLQTTYRPKVDFPRLRLVQPGGFTAIADGTLDTLITGPDAATINPLVEAARDANNEVQIVINAVDISGMIDDPVTLNRDNFAAMSNHFEALENAIQQISLAPGDTEFETTVQEAFNNLILLPRAIALALVGLDNNAALPEGEDIGRAINSLRGDTELRQAIVDLIALEKHAAVTSLTTEDDNSISTSIYAAFNSNADWISPPDAPHASVGDIDPSGATLAGANLRLTALNAAAALKAPFDTLAEAIISLFELAEFLASEAETQMFANHPIYKAAVEQVQKTMSILPCSGAVAGIYATVDRTRGVWKAPANVSVNDVVGPAVKINDAGQADLNVHYTGKSINAIRAFTGKGTLVWGARTLAGNDNEWRYVPVRRFFNMAEESIKKATEPFVFEPNDANTWVRVRAMIENFLTLQWRAGALAGAKTEQAFYVKVGLGETMTAQDILEGRMIVEIGMAVVRPAEFIILKFAHKMQVS